MRQLALADAEVDVCDACGGLWVDWFDGEVRAIASETLRASSLATPSSTDATNERASRNEAMAVGACPRCTRQLVPERYVVKADVPGARGGGPSSVVAGTSGAELLRCEDCLGAFVSRSSAEVLSWLSSTSEPLPSEAPVKVQPLPWVRLIALAKSLFGVREKT